MDRSSYDSKPYFASKDLVQSDWNIWFNRDSQKQPIFLMVFKLGGQWVDMVLWSSHNTNCATSWYAEMLLPETNGLCWKLLGWTNPLLVGKRNYLPSLYKVCPGIGARFPTTACNVDKNQSELLIHMCFFLITYLACMQILFLMVACIIF